LTDGLGLATAAAFAGLSSSRKVEPQDSAESATTISRIRRI
jgi:hypothetical protein